MTSQTWTIANGVATPKIDAPPPAKKYNLDDPEFLKGMLDPSIYAGLTDPNIGKNQFAGITGQGKTFMDFYNPASTAGSDQDFSSYLQSIQAPSSVDAVQKSLEQEYLQQTLDSIGRDTEGAVGGIKSDMLDRGLGDAGRTSDIEANAIAQARAGGARTAAGARTQMGMAELARQKAREDEMKAALGQKYQTGVSRETQANQIGAQGAMTSAQMMNALLGQEYGGAESAAGRAFTGASTAAQLQGSDRQKFFSNLLDSLLKNKTIDSSDNQFFRGLENTNSQNALGRTAAYDTAILNKSQQGDQGFMDYLGKGIGMTKDLIGIGSSLWGPGGGKGLLTK